MLIFYSVVGIIYARMSFGTIGRKCGVCCLEVIVSHQFIMMVPVAGAAEPSIIPTQTITEYSNMNTRRVVLLDSKNFE